MPSIASIPPPYVNGFKKLYLLSSTDFEAVHNGLLVTSLNSSVGKLATIVTESNRTNRELIYEIFMSVGSLTTVLERGVSIDETSDDIYNALLKEVSSKEEHELHLSLSTEGGKNTFIERLSSLLKTDRIYYAAKANILMREYQNVFIETRIVSDIRPIYSLDTEQSPKCAMIIHNLHIHYQRDKESDHKDIYLALDSSDLKDLKEAILRAEKKEVSLNEIFKQSNMININE